jgi:WD40 repeat protein
MRRWLCVLIPLGLASAFGIWRFAARSGDETIGAAETAALTAALPPRSSPWETGQGAPAPAQPTEALHDPILVGPCHLFPIAEQDVSCQIDGAIDDIAVELGQIINAGQLVARLDDRQVRPQVELLRLKATSKAAEAIAKALYDEAEGKVKYAQEANASGLKAVSDLELQNYIAQKQRFAQEMVKAREDQQAAALELDKVRAHLDIHQIRSVLTGEVVKVFKRKGEAVKQGEPLFRIAVYQRLRAEGLCKADLAKKLTVGMRALVEPSIRGEPNASLTGHTAPVRGLAITPDGRLLASAGEDREVLLWRWPEAQLHQHLSHPAEVYAVAFAAGPTGHLLLTGCADFRVRLWSVSARGDVSGPVVFAREHDGAVLAVAFSPDGRRCVTAGEDRRIGVWDVATAKFQFWIRGGNDGPPTAHHGAVTAVSFLPDGRLLSAARDNTLKVWHLGTHGATLGGTRTGRTGDVLQPGASPDGRWVLFDHGEELWLLRHDGWTLSGRIQSQQHGHFQGVAVASPSGRLVLTTSTSGRTQLWKAPLGPEQVAFFRRAAANGFHPGALMPLAAAPFSLDPVEKGLPPLGHGLPTMPRLWSVDAVEVRHFLTPNAAVICAAFTPDETIVFTAGSDKVIRAWPVPPVSHWSLPQEACVTFIGNQVERGTDMVRLRAELDNPADPSRRLLPGMFTTLRFYPETAGSR